jgi:hypothetical protein
VSIWHIITGEYPPQIGGVSDYTSLVANGLAEAGNVVHVWAPVPERVEDRSSRASALPSVEQQLQSGNRFASDIHNSDCAEPIVHRLPGHFGLRSLVTLDRKLRTSLPSTVLVQYVPHAFGYKAMNLPLCLWLNTLRNHKLVMMFHEVAFPLNRRQSARHQMLGVITRLMAWTVSRSASGILVAGAQWESMLRKLGATAPVHWAPVPATVPVIKQPAATTSWRKRCLNEGGLLLGHFANYSDYSAERLSQAVPALLASNNRLALLLLGANSNQLRTRLIAHDQSTSGQIFSTGVLDQVGLSAALAACDLMVQPYSDGVSTRRTSMTGLLAHGRAIITTSGPATEPLWKDSGALSLAPADDAGELQRVVTSSICSREKRRRHEQAALAFYEEHFALRHTIAILMNPDSN